MNEREVRVEGRGEFFGRPRSEVFRELCDNGERAVLNRDAGETPILAIRIG